MTGKILIFVLDDSQGEIILLKDRLSSEPFFEHVKFFTDQKQFVAEFSEDVNLTIIDYMLAEGMTGLEILRLIVKSNPICKNIIVSGMADRELAVQFMREGAADFIAKDHENYFEELIQAINRLLPVVDHLQRIKSKWFKGVD